MSASLHCTEGLGSLAMPKSKWTSQPALVQERECHCNTLLLARGFGTKQTRKGSITKQGWIRLGHFHDVV